MKRRRLIWLVDCGRVTRATRGAANFAWPEGGSWPFNTFPG